MNWINKSLFNRLLAIFTGGCLLILVAVAYYVVQVTRSVDTYAHLLEHEISHERQVDQMLAELQAQVQEWKNILLRGADEQDLAKYWGSFQEREATIRKVGEALLTEMEVPQARELISQFLASHRKMGQRYREGLQVFKDAGFDPFAGDQAVKGIDRDAINQLEQAAALIAAEAQSESAAIPSQVDRATFQSALVLIAVVIGFLITALFAVDRSLIRPSRQLITLIDDLSQGRLNGKIDIQRQDELGTLAVAAQRLQTFLRTVAQELSSSANGLGKATSAMEAVAADIDQHTTHANDRVTLVAAAMQEMTAAAQEVASHAQNAASVATQADHAAKAGQAAMNRARDAVERVAGQLGSSVQVVAKLDEDTRNVGNVLNVIRAIAEQTNLLALNAAIEAARAGDQGRGFAVVADEVRTLAQRTQASTAEIQVIIESVQNGARDTVAVMEASRGLSDESVGIFEEADSQLQHIAQAINEINGLNTQVATAAEEQTSVADDIARDLAEIANQTEHTAHTVQDFQKTATMLAQMSQGNIRLSQRFSGV